MVPVLPIIPSASIKTALLSATTTRGFFSSTTAASSRPRPSVLLTRPPRRHAFSAATDPVLEGLTAGSTSAMGRSGYDTTNMRVAQNPRPAAAAARKKKTEEASAVVAAAAAAKKNKKKKTQEGQGGEASSAPARAQNKVQRGADLLPEIPIPRGCEEGQCTQEGHEIPVPTLVGRGWTF